MIILDPDLVAKIAQIASVLEVSGYPKPGNVHRTQDFEDMIFEDFLISGIVIGDVMKKAALKGAKYKDQPDSLYKIRLGELIKEAVNETNKWIDNNTNLGIILLLTPLSAAAGMSNNFMELRDNIDQIMRATTPMDALNLYDSINIADAGGMGERDELDVGSEKAKIELLKNEINMFQVLDISSEWDMLSFELTNQMPVTFEVGFPLFKDIKTNYGMNKATIQTFLTILSEFPDTLISRKYGADMAMEVLNDAKYIIDMGGILNDEGYNLLEDFDKTLISKKLNPGTTADLTASSIMVAFLEEFTIKKILIK
jgi:triphosphoribosyl-dephospho-CoA synthase